MSAIFRILGFMMFVLLLGGAFWAAFNSGEVQESRKRTVSLYKDIAEDVKVSRHGLYGIDLVTCGRIRTEKIRRGFFAIGAFNVLVIDDLKVVLPLSGDRRPAETKARGTEDSGSALNVLRDIGVDSGFLRQNGGAKRFSGLRINGFELARLDSETNVVHVLTARRAVMKRFGLELSAVSIGDGHAVKKTSRALIEKSRGGLRVVWSEGELFL